MENIHITINKNKIKCSELEESIRNLRTNMLAKTGQQKSLLVTSAQNKEGKSTISLLLALTLSKCGKRTVWINCDTRKKNEFIEYLDYKGEQDKVSGLSDLLAGDKSVEEAIISTDCDNLFVLLDGTKTDMLVDLYEGEKFVEVLNVLKEQYDYVIIDSISEKKCPDTRILASKCDGVILVMQYKRFSHRIIGSTINNIRQSNGNIIGVVLNKIKKT